MCRRRKVFVQSDSESCYYQRRWLPEDDLLLGSASAVTSIVLLSLDHTGDYSRRERRL